MKFDYNAQVKRLVFILKVEKKKKRFMYRSRVWAFCHR